MDSAVIGFIGTILGGVIAIIGIVVTSILASKRDDKGWARTQKKDAYTNAIRALYCLVNRRSKLTADGFAVIGREEVKDWFNDYIDALNWIAQISIYAPKAYEHYHIGEMTHRLRVCFNHLMRYDHRIRSRMKQIKAEPAPWIESKASTQTADATQNAASDASDLGPDFTSILEVAEGLLQLVLEAAQNDIGEEALSVA